MNIISWDRAYCLYPHATLETPRVSFLLDSRFQHAQENLDKYAARGWRLVDPSDLPDGALRCSPDIRRCIGDGHSWVIKLDLERLSLPPAVNALTRPFSRDPCCVTSWVLEVKWDSCTLVFDLIKRGGALQYNYPVFLDLWRGPLKEIDVEWSRAQRQLSSYREEHEL